MYERRDYKGKALQTYHSYQMRKCCRNFHKTAHNYYISTLIQISISATK